MTMGEGRKRTVACGLVGVTLLLTGCALIIVFNDMFHRKVQDYLPLKNGTEAYNDWLSPPVPVYFQVWVLHVANHKEVTEEGAKPVLLEMGPYTYREERRKVDVEYTENDTISFREDVWFYFDPQMSVGPDNQTFTTINLPMLTIATLLRYQYGFIEELADLVLDATGEHLFVTLSVAQLLWGYEDPLLKDIHDLLVRHHVHLPFNDTFGLFAKQNGSDNGLYRIYTGVDTTDHLAHVASWNNYTTLPYWTSPYANTMRGSDGTKYPPFVDISIPYYMFSAQLCRSLEITYSDTYVLQGIEVKRFTLPQRVLADVKDNPDNRGFCTPKSNCLPAGLLNVSVCREGAPLVFSQPHFLDGDPRLNRDVLGLKPQRSQHEVFIAIEPMTGMVMHLGKRLQINVYLENISHIKETYNIRRPIYLPVLWINETAVIDEASADKFKDEVMQPLRVMETIQYGLIALGVFCIASVIFFYANQTFSAHNPDENTVPDFMPLQRKRKAQQISERTPLLLNQE